MIQHNMQQSKSKKMRRSHHTKHLPVDDMNDRITKLPDDICIYILSLLPTYDSVKTSLLSRSWKDLWTKVDTLNFDFLQFSSWKKGPKKNQRATFVNFVSHLLELPELSHIRKLRLSLDDCSKYWGKVNDWIDYAMRCQFQELDLCIHRGAKKKLLEPLFTCQSVRVLKLCLPGEILRLPTSVSLSRLQKLHLNQIRFSNAVVLRRLISRCPVLENLIMEKCQLRRLKFLDIHHSKLKILKIFNCHYVNNCLIKVQAQSLQSFEYTGFMARDYSLEDLAALSCACVYFKTPSFTLLKRKENIRRLINLLQGLARVKVLKICPLCIAYLSLPKVLESLSFQFSNMTHLNLATYGAKNIILTIVGLLKICPKVEYLSVKTVKRTPYWLPKPMKKPTPTFELFHLETTVMKHFEDENKAAWMRFLLKSAKALH